MKKVLLAIVVAAATFFFIQACGTGDGVGVGGKVIVTGAGS